VVVVVAEGWLLRIYCLELTIALGQLLYTKAFDLHWACLDLVTLPSVPIFDTKVQVLQSICHSARRAEYLVEHAMLGWLERGK
jgi:hypothetical protein